MPTSSISQKSKRRPTLDQRMQTIDKMDGLLFEKFVAERLQKRGYRTENIGASGDFGVDVIANDGDQRWAVQVKRYKSNVSRTAVSDAVAGKFYWKCEAAWVVTNSYFTKDAKTLAEHTGCRLSDRDDLRHWLYEEEKAITTQESPKRKQETRAPLFPQGWRRNLTIFCVALISIMLLTGPSTFSQRLRQGIRQGVVQGVTRVTQRFQPVTVLEPQPSSPNTPAPEASPANTTTPLTPSIPFSSD